MCVEWKIEKEIDAILDVKEEHKYYRESQEYTSFQDIKMHYHLRLTYQKRQSNFLKMMLKNLKDIIGENGYFIKEGENLSSYYDFQIKLDPISIDKNVVLFAQIRELLDFSQGYLSFREGRSKIEILGLKEKVWDKDKVHKRLLSFLLEQSSCFSMPIKMMPYLWNYQAYFSYQVDHGTSPMILNYLKRTEIEICNIRSDINIATFKNLLTGFLFELYYEQFSWRERRELRNSKKMGKSIYSVLEYLDQQRSREPFTNKKKVLVYALDRRTPVLLDLSKELLDAIEQELTVKTG